MSAGAARAYRCRSLDGRWSFDILDGASVTVGREPAFSDVAVPITVMSRRHARFRNEAGVLTVQDEGSRGGIRVNGVRLATGMSQLSAGGRVMLAGVEFVVEEAGAGE